MPTLHETIEPEKRVRRITVLISGSGTYPPYLPSHTVLLPATLRPPSQLFTRTLAGCPSLPKLTSGSNLQALLDSSLTERLPNAQVTFVLSSRSNAYGLERAKNNSPQVPTAVCALKTFLNRNPGSERTDYDAEVARLVLESKPDLVVLAGWMHILSDAFLDILDGRAAPPAKPALPPPLPSAAADAEKSHVKASELQQSETRPSLPPPPVHQHFPIPCINLHPALPGAFDGANAIGRAFEAGQKGDIEKTGVMVHRVIREVDRGEPLVVREIPIRKEETLEQLEERIHEVEHQIIVEGAKLVLEELEKEEAQEAAELTDKINKLDVKEEEEKA
ncbi:phosphoribosylglycinamide formyltransferase [Trichosporon asahii var. asahii CBS 8904]|uniref:phosphoribosylglycinamide formyltransferase 1 n=1 Tax=Trichosporon asahii var. asahii (strain CBS 8904) TaxID=1220162 RepID=K1WCT3_TRIAC|nr:phosphoribosylglycinamide formyltransferase [Trichosporon asahii var. asahii CBS 8904]